MENRELKELLTALPEGQSADWNALFCEIEPTIKAICTDFFPVRTSRRTRRRTFA